MVLDKLQKLNFTAARLITGTKRYEHIKPALRDLPVESRVIFKSSAHYFQDYPRSLSSLLNVPPRTLPPKTKPTLIP